MASVVPDRIVAKRAEALTSNEENPFVESVIALATDPLGDTVDLNGERGGSIGADVELACIASCGKSSGSLPLGELSRACLVPLVVGVVGFPDDDPGTGGNAEGGEYRFCCPGRLGGDRERKSSRFGEDMIPSRVDI